MIRKVALIASCFLLTSCGTLFNRPPPPPPILPATICAEKNPGEPVLPANAGLVQPATPEEIAATAATLNWTGAVLAWGRQGWAGLERAQAQGCSK